MEPRTSCGGFLSYSRAKSKFVAQQSLLHFVASHKTTYFWTNTFSEDVSHQVAVERCKPLFDWLRRKTVDFLFFWERTKAGRWHLHWVCDSYIDVNWFRAWMVARGWGQQMMVKRALYAQCVTFRDGWTYESSQVRGLMNYLTKYLTKSFGIGDPGVKVWGGPARCRMGTIGFKWMPSINPKAMLYYYGREIFEMLHNRRPKFTSYELGVVMKLGYEASGWCDVDPWFFDTG